MKKMKLLAMDHEDLNVISAHVQDAVSLLGDFKWLSKECRFIIPMNRFVWENETGKKKTHERRRSVLHFNLVNSVRSHGLQQDKKDAVLSLLSVCFEETDKPGGIVKLNFSAGATIQLHVECLEAQLTDLDGAWETLSKPNHDLEST